MAVRITPRGPQEGTDDRAARPAGRPRTFEPAQKLAAAIALFRERGYEATSLDELTRGMKLSRSSFYACFGSKRDVLHAAVERYSAACVEDLAQIARSLPPIEAVRAMVRAVAFGGEASHGCLVINAVCELAPRDPVLANLARGHIAAVEAQLRAVVPACGTAAPAAAHNDVAGALVAASMGAATMRRAGVPDGQVEALLDCALANLLRPAKG